LDRDPPDSASSTSEDEAGHSSEHAREAFSSLTDAATELVEYIRHFLSAKLDLARLAGRRMFLRWAAMALSIVAAGAVVVTGMVLICIGVARALGELFGVQWVADVVTGAIGLVVVAGLAWVSVWYLGRNIPGVSFEEKYDQRRRHQRNRFGRDVGDWEHMETDYE
jgi:hypothetical protein